MTAATLAAPDRPRRLMRLPPAKPLPRQSRLASARTAAIQSAETFQRQSMAVPAKHQGSQPTPALALPSADKSKLPPLRRLSPQQDQRDSGRPVNHLRRLPVAATNPAAGIPARDLLTRIDNTVPATGLDLRSMRALISTSVAATHGKAGERSATTTAQSVAATRNAMLTAALILALFNSEAMTSYARDLSPNLLTDAMVVAADGWHAAMENVGLTRLTGPLKDLVLWLRDLRF